MEESEKNTIVKTKWTLLRNLDCINEFVDANGLPIDDHMILDDIKDSLKSLRCIKELMTA